MTASSQTVKTTVGILTVGDPAFKLCQAALETQTYKNFQLEIISKVSPFNAAFQELVRRSSTEYVIQVDEDMIMFPYAVGRMQEVMDAAPPEIGMVLFYLIDPDRNQRIHGIKIFRTAALRKIWAKDIKASEMELLEQMLEVGYRWVIHPETMGRHGVVYSPETIYSRYKTMYEKDITTWNAVTIDIRRKADAYARTGDPVELFALLGAAHGVMNVPFLDDKEKDFTKYNTKALTVLKQALLAYPAQSFPFEVGKSETQFKSTPIPFEQVAWKNDTASISEQAILANRQDTAPADELVAIDQRIIENIPVAAFEQQLAQQPNDGFMHMWYGLALWHQNEFKRAWSQLDQALSLGAPAWRISWYKVMLIRDDRNLWGKESFETAKSFVQQILVSRPNFEPAKLALAYLEPGNANFAGGVLAQDFLRMNSSSSSDLSQVNHESELEGTIGKLEQRLIRPALVIIDGLVRGHDGASVRELMLNSGYILWHTDFRFSMYRASETMSAPNFWNFKTLLPIHQFQSPQVLEPKIEPVFKMKSPPKLSENVARYLAQAKIAIDSGKLEEAQRLIQEGLSEDPTNQVLADAQKMISEAIELF